MTLHSAINFISAIMPLGFACLCGLNISSSLEFAAIPDNGFMPMAVFSGVSALAAQLINSTRTP